MPAAPETLTRLLRRWNGGDLGARDRVFPLVYEELRRLAQRNLRRERADHTFQGTALVHEAYLRLASQRRVTWQNRSHFFGLAAQAMRRILVDHARGRQALKRGGEWMRVTLTDPRAVAASAEAAVDLLALDAALAELGALDAQQARIVELRFFAGLSVEEAAEVLAISATTVKREWSLARAWLYRRIRRD